jgi:hypothetical protein
VKTSFIFTIIASKGHITPSGKMAIKQYEIRVNIHKKIVDTVTSKTPNQHSLVVPWKYF